MTLEHSSVPFPRLRILVSIRVLFTRNVDILANKYNSLEKELVIISCQMKEKGEWGAYSRTSGRHLNLSSHFTFGRNPNNLPTSRATHKFPPHPSHDHPDHLDRYAKRRAD